MTPLTLLFWLIAAHFIADYVFQTDFIARGKSPLANPQIVPWRYLMYAHAVTHAAAVVLITGNVWLGLIELNVHFFTDLMKCRGVFGIHVDQAIHLACKVAFALAVVR